MGKLAIIGDYDSARPTHVATNESIRHVEGVSNYEISSEWIGTSWLNDKVLENFQGIWIAPGPPYESLQNCFAAIKYVREKLIPILGTCQGFQAIIMEYAQNVLCLPEVIHQEYSPTASNPFITKSLCSLSGQTMNLELVPNTKVSEIYGTSSIDEKYYCSFEINRDYYNVLEESDLMISGKDQDSSIRIVELEKHPFFVGTLFVPQASSTEMKPHPIVKKFIDIVRLRV